MAAADAVGVGDVELRQLGRAAGSADQAHGLLAGRRVAHEVDVARALRRAASRRGDRPADAARRAGDERHLIGQRAVHPTGTGTCGGGGRLSRCTSTTCRPRYWPQCGQARCRTMASPHSGHGTVAGAVSASWARRLLRFE